MKGCRALNWRSSFRTVKLIFSYRCSSHYIISSWTFSPCHIRWWVPNCNFNPPCRRSSASDPYLEGLQSYGLTVRPLWLRLGKRNSEQRPRLIPWLFGDANWVESESCQANLIIWAKRSYKVPHLQDKCDILGEVRRLAINVIDAFGARSHPGVIAGRSESPRIAISVPRAGRSSHFCPHSASAQGSKGFRNVFKPHHPHSSATLSLLQHPLQPWCKRSLCCCRSLLSLACERVTLSPEVQELSTPRAVVPLLFMPVVVIWRGIGLKVTGPLVGVTTFHTKPLQQW
jgi:hypothetical protein